MIKKTIIQEAVENNGFGYFGCGKTALLRVNSKAVDDFMQFASENSEPVHYYNNGKEALADELAEQVLTSKSQELNRTSAPTEEEQLLADELVITKRAEFGKFLRPYVDKAITLASPVFMDAVEKEVFQHFTAEEAHSIGFDKSNEAWAIAKDEAMAQQIKVPNDVIGDEDIAQIIRNVRDNPCCEQKLHYGDYKMEYGLGKTKEKFTAKWSKW